jgi:hypothetical protein
MDFDGNGAGYGLVTAGSQGQRLCSNGAKLHIAVQTEHSTERYKRAAVIGAAEFAVDSGTCGLRSVTLLFPL